jgi:hypothetical protein
LHTRAQLVYVWKKDITARKKLRSLGGVSIVSPGEHMVLSSCIGVGVGERERRKKGEAEQSNRGRKCVWLSLH